MALPQCRGYNYWMKKRTDIIILAASLFLIFMIIFFSVCSILSSSGIFFRIVFGAGILAMRICLSLFRVLVLRSFSVIWLPVALYLVMSWFIRNSLIKKAVLLLVISIDLAFLANVVFPSPYSILLSFTKMPLVFGLVIQLYMFLLFFLPNELWNFLGGFVLFLKGSAVTLLPDLPSFLDDFGIILAVFSFIFLYLNTVTGLVKRAGKRESVERAEKVLMAFHAACGNIRTSIFEKQK